MVMFLGNTDQNLLNNNSSTTFAGLGIADTGMATIDITTDNYGDEITWTLETYGMVIASGGPYQGGSSIQAPTAYATLAQGACYSFTIYDSYGDGIISPGFYMVKDGTGNVLAYGGSNYTTEDKTNFETASIGTSIIEIGYAEQSDNRMFDVLGRQYKNYRSIPFNTIYIQNNIKHVKTK